MPWNGQRGAVAQPVVAAEVEADVATVVAEAYETVAVAPAEAVVEVVAAAAVGTARVAAAVADIACVEDIAGRPVAVGSSSAARTVVAQVAPDDKLLGVGESVAEKGICSSAAAE